jgi:outer membrane protein assembly factor BamB
VAAALLATFMPRLFPAWGEGVFGWAWFYTGGIGLAGLVAAIGWSAPRSLWRLAGALALLAAATYLYRNIGLNSYGQTFKREYRLVMISPALAGALWHTLVFVRARRAGSAPGAPKSALAGAGLAAMAVLLFVTVNLWQPRAGLMRAVLCYDLESGRLLWDAPLFVAPQEQKYEINSFATPTPCTDGERVFAYFGSGWACLNMDGRILWQGRDDEYAPNTRYGSASSPIPFEDTFIVLQEKEYVRPSFIMGLDKETGRKSWVVNPWYASDSYGTPVLMPRDSGVELVTVSAERAVAHDPRNGEELWSVKVPVRQMVPTPVYSGDLLLVSGGTHTKTSSTGIRLRGTGRETQPEILWQTTKGVPTVSSPVLVGDLYFTITELGIMSCSDPQSGEVHWKERIEGVHFWSSLVAGDGKVYACSEDGVITVVAAKPEFEVLGRGELGDLSFASPAIADGCIVFRTSEHLYCFGGPTEG